MYHAAEIRDFKEITGGTLLKVFVPDSRIGRQIERYKADDNLTVEIRIDDNRSITNMQRKKYFSTIADVAEYTGHLTETLHDYFKTLYRIEYEDIHISMSDCTVTQAKDMITLLMDFVLDNEIPLTSSGVDRADDIGKYLYSCLINRRCCICGRKADIHHVVGSKIGMGNDRDKVDHVGRFAMALCRDHHRAAEAGDEKEYFDKYKVFPVRLDEYAVKKTGI